MPKPGQFNSIPRTENTFSMLSARICEKMEAYANTGDSAFLNINLKVDEAVSYAIEEIKRERVFLGPDINNPDKSLEEFWETLSPDSYRNLPEKSKFSGNSEEMKRRRQFSDKCSDALMSALEDVGKRELTFRMTAKGLFPDKALNVGRWMEQLIQFPQENADINAKKECELHNETVVTLAALIQGKITVEEFEQTRQNHWKQKGLDANAAEKAAKDDVLNAPKLLFDMVDSVIQNGRPNDAEVKSLTDAVMNGELEGDNLKQAYKKIFNNSCQLRFAILDCVNDMNALMSKVGVHPEQFNDKWQHDYVMQCQRESQPLLTCQSLAGAAANPYYAILDPAQMADINFTQIHKESVIQADPEDNYSYNAAFASDVCCITKQEFIDMEEILKGYNLENAVDEPFPGGRRLQAFADNRQGRTLIFEREELSVDHGYRFNVKVTENPGLYVSEGFAEKVNAMSELGASLTYGHHGSSDQYELMMKSLNKLKNVTLDANAPDEQLDNMKQQLEAVREAAAGYFERKEPKRTARGGKGKNQYEEDRWNFAQNLDRFAKGKLEQLEAVRRHKITAADTRNIARELHNVEDNLSEVKVDAHWNNAPDNSVNAMISAYINGNIKIHEAYMESGSPEDVKEAANRGQKALAAGTVNYMLGCEKEPHKLETVVKKGGLEQLVNLVMNSGAFKEEIKKIDLKSNDKLKEYLSSDKKFCGKVGYTILQSAIGGRRNIVNNQNQQIRQHQAGNNPPVLHNNQNPPTMNRALGLH